MKVKKWWKVQSYWLQGVAIGLAGVTFLIITSFLVLSLIGDLSSFLLFINAKQSGERALIIFSFIFLTLLTFGLGIIYVILKKDFASDNKKSNLILGLKTYAILSLLVHSLMGIGQFFFTEGIRYLKGGYYLSSLAIIPQVISIIISILILISINGELKWGYSVAFFLVFNLLIKYFLKVYYYSDSFDSSSFSQIFRLLLGLAVMYYIYNHKEKTSSFSLNYMF